ncbi:MAG: hypothetical protein C5B51_29600, partial [Terriglobia bacterium]
MPLDSIPWESHRFLDVERWAIERPDAVALLAPGRAPLSYSALQSHIQTASQALKDCGLASGEAAALVMHGAELVTAFLAIARDSACAPLNPALTEDEYRFHLSRLGVGIVLVQEPDSKALAVARELGIRTLRIHSADHSPAGVFSLESDGAPKGPGRKTEAALLLYSSATTGSPKLIPLTCANLSAIALHNSRALELSQSDRFLALAPLYHSFGLGTVLTQLSCGGSVICTPTFEPDLFPRWLEDFRPTWICGAPPVLRAITALARQHPESFRDLPLRFIQTFGSPADQALLQSIEEVIHAPVFEAYGTTEAVAITRNVPGARKQGSVGRSIGSEVAIMDESGAILSSDTEGEVVVRGPTLMAGYIDDPEANRAAFRDGWFRTGDIGRLDSEGFLYLTGRLKEIINRGGQKIVPSEVDRVLASHFAVVDVATFAVPHPTLGQEVAAAVVFRNGCSVSESLLREFAAARLAPFKIPRRIIFVDAIPRDPAGKLRRGELAERFRVLADRPMEYSQPPDAMETSLIEIWTRILNVRLIGVDDNFFSLGGDSLSATVMFREVQTSINANLEGLQWMEFFEQPTVANLARILSQVVVSSDRPCAGCVLPVQRRGSRLPFFCFAPDPNPYYLRHLAKCLGEEQPFYIVCPPDPVRDNRLLKIEDLARLLVAGIRDVSPSGPYVFGGHCYGGVVAFEAALQLLSQNEEIAQLVLFDVPTPGYPKVTRSWRKYLAESRRMFAAA